MIRNIKKRHYLYISIIGNNYTERLNLLKKLNIKKIYFLKHYINLILKNNYNINLSYLFFFEIPLNNINNNIYLDKINKSSIIIFLTTLIDYNYEYNKFLLYIENKNIPIILIINEINYLLYKKNVNFIHKFINIFYIKYINNIEVKKIINYIYNYINNNNTLFKNKTTDINTKEIIYEITKEKLINFIKKINVKNLLININNLFTKKNIFYIYITISVKNLCEKKIIIGKEGKSIKYIGILVREDLEFFFNKKICLKTNINYI